MRGAARAAAWLGWIVLGAAALVGLVLSAVVYLASVPFARAAVASAVVRIVDEALAGGAELGGIEVLSGGGIELRDLRVFDPDGHLVLAVGRARLSVDVTALRSRTIGVELELDHPSVLLEEEADGGVSLVRAFAPARSSPAPAAAPLDARGGGGASAWTVHLSRLVIHGGEVWWVDAAGSTRLEASALDVAGRGTLGPRRARAELRLRGELREPFAAPLALELVAVRGGDAVRVPVLHVTAGGTSVEALAEGDVARRRGRLAVTRLGISRAQARAVVPSAPEGADLRATGYAESDGTTLTAALRVEPVEAGGAGGRGDAAIAVHLDAIARAAGFDVALEHLDPSRVVAAAPQGDVTLTAHGAAAGASLDDARARIALSVSRTRLRRGEVTRADLQLRVVPGAVELDRLAAAAPGITVAASGHWRRGGPVAGTATADAQDVAIAARNLARLLGEPAPAVAGRARLAATLSGTSSVPALEGTLDAGSLRAGAVAAEGLRLAVRGTGPLDAIEGRAEGKIAQLHEAGGREIAHRIAFRAALHEDDGTLSVTGAVPGTGTEPLSVDARGRLGARRETLVLNQLALSWPGTRWTLVRPAALNLRATSVDRLELASDPQRIVISGGLGSRGALEARVELSRLDLGRLPPGILPEGDGVRGEVSASLQASGTAAHPVLSGRMAVADGAWRNLSGVAASAEGRFDGATRRIAASVLVERGAGGTVDVALDLPVPLASRPAEPVTVRVRAAALPIADLLEAARSGAVATGTVALDLHLGGTAGAPSLGGEASVTDASWQDLDRLGVTVTLEQGMGVVRAAASASIAGRRAVAVEAEVPLELGDLLARPGETLRAVERAPVVASAKVTALDLAAVAGRAGVPPGLTGIVDARVDLTGSPAAPRGAATIDVTGGAWKGWRLIGGHVELAAREQGLAASGRITASGADAVRFQASLAVRPERLTRRDALLAAPLRVEATIPHLALAAGEGQPVAGTLDARFTTSGTLRAPEVALDASGGGISISGRPLGDARATARYAARRGRAEVVLDAAAGGSVRATAELSADLGAGARGASIRDAPAEVSAVADGLDLGFLPVLAPSLIRSAGGQLALDVHAQGPLARLSPRGTLRVAGGRLAVAELGEWTDIGIEARVSDDVVELSRFELRRGAGRLSAHGALRGVRSEAARLSGKITAQELSVARAGMNLATFDVAADLSGAWRPGELQVEVAVPHGVVRLPKKTPRTLQSLDRRKDISIGRKPEQKRQVEAAKPGDPGANPFSVQVHLVVPRDFFVKSDSPKVDVELKADVRYELSGGQDYAEGSIEVVRGSVEPIAGRNFIMERGRVQFTGGPPRAALLDVEAKYQNPAAVVTVNVSGAATAPEIRLSSQPPMDDAQIAMLIATGRTELKPGSGAVGTLTGEEAGKAALGALATQAFRNIVRDKLPLDTVALDSGALRAGKYLTDKIYVGYVRRFDADPTKNENEDEVRVEYQITPRWMFESRYGNAQSGGASLIWSRNY